MGLTLTGIVVMPEPVDFHALFSRLQSRYPTSSLLCELVQTHEGLFVVRAIVQVGSVPLVSSHAAAASVEQAEDGARLRVLALLGIQPVGSGLPTARTELPNPPLPNPLESPLPAPLRSTPTVGITPFPAQEPSSLPRLSDPIPAPPPMPSLTFEPDTFESDTLESESFESGDSFEPDVEEAAAPAKPARRSAIPGLEEPPAPTRKRTIPDFDNLDTVPNSEDEATPDLDAVASASKPKNGLSKLKVDRTRTPEPEPEESLPKGPVDLSELIALTDVEMQRVGWTKKRGQTYLKETYNKDKRADLDEEQLMDFLHFLRALPSRYESPV